MNRVLKRVDMCLNSTKILKGTILYTMTLLLVTVKHVLLNLTLEV